MKITDKAKVLVAGLAVLAMSAVAMPANAFTCPNGKEKSGSDYTQACKNDGLKTNQETDLMSVMNTIINVVIGVIGFVAVAMIIVGGFQYTTSSGDTGKVTKAKNTIMYGIIGLVVALLAFAIVNFVLSNVFGSNS